MLKLAINSDPCIKWVVVEQFIFTHIDKKRETKSTEVFRNLSKKQGSGFSSPLINRLPHISRLFYHKISLMGCNAVLSWHTWPIPWTPLIGQGWPALENELWVSTIMASMSLEELSSVLVWWPHYLWFNQYYYKMSCLFLSPPTYLSSIMASSTQTQAQVNSQKFIYWLHKTTTHDNQQYQWHSRFSEILYKKLPAVWPSTWHDAIW